MTEVMDCGRIAELLLPFAGKVELPPGILEQLQLYLDLLLRWNARVNLTSIRTPEEVVTRHFGESLFAARILAGDSAKRHANPKPLMTLADVGSGGGFPGIPIKLWAPDVRLTLIESQNKKATFLREVLRALKLEDAEVFFGRAEKWGKTADVVTLRAVEQFEAVLPVAAALVAPNGRLCLLVGEGQIEVVRRVAGPLWTWDEPVFVPRSAKRVILIGKKNQAQL